MKQGVHPDWFNEAKVTCACGNTFTTGSTVAVIQVDICSKCHPLFTGQQKFIDTLGQVDKFQKKAEVSAKKVEVRKAIVDARSSKVKEEKKEKPSLKDLLMQARKQSSA